MKRQIIETREFMKEIDALIAKKKLINNDFETLKNYLAQNPAEGDLIRGTGGLRKIRLKAPNKGKSGGFRVYYYDDANNKIIWLLWLHPKNEQENITAQETSILKKTIKELL